MAQIFTTSKHVLGVLQTSISSFTTFVSWLTGQAGGGGLLCSFLETELSDPVFWGKCPDYGYPSVNFSLKMQFYEYLGENHPDFSHKTFCLFVVAEIFLAVALFLEVYSVQKTGCTPGRPQWLADKSEGMSGFWTS